MYPRRGFGWFPKTGRRHEQPWQFGPREQCWQDEPRPNWNQYHPEQKWKYSQWKQDNYYNHNFPTNFESGGNFSGRVPYQGSYWRRPQGNVHQKSHYRGRFNKGPKSSFSKESGDWGNSSSTLNNVTTVKKESDSVKTEAPSAAPKETERDQTGSAALTKQSNSCQVETKASKVIISPLDFSFRLPHDSSAFPQNKQELLKKPEEIKAEPGTAFPKAEDGHRQAPCVLAVPLSSSVTLKNLRPIKEEKNIELVPINDGQTVEDPSSRTASVPSAEVFSEQQRLSQTTEGFRCMVKQEPVAEITQDMTCPRVTDLPLLEPPAPLKGRENIPSLGKKETTPVQPCTISSHADQSKLHQGGFLRHQELVKEPRKISKLQIQLKGGRTAKELSHYTTPIEAPTEQQALFKTAKYFHSMEKEEPVQLQDAEDLPHQPASLLSFEAPIKEQRPAEITEGAYSVKKEELLLLEDRPPMHHFSSSVLIDIPFLFDATGYHQSEKNEETELTQLAGSHESGDHNQTSVAVASSSSNLLTTGSDIHSVPVLVREKDIDLTNFWETPSLHAEHLRGWAPEDYQEPPESQDKADKCDRMPDYKRDLVPHHSSSCTHASCDKKSDTRRVVEGCSCSPKRHRSGDSRHSSKSQASRELHSLPRRGRSPPRRRRSPPRSPPRRGRSPPRSPPRRGRSPPRSPPRRGRSPPRSPPRRGRSPPRSPPRRGRSPPRSPPRRGRSPPRSPPRRGRSPPRSPPRRGRSPPRSPPRRGRSPPRSPPRRGRSPPRSPPRRGRSPPRSPPRRGSPPQSPPQLSWSPPQSLPQSLPEESWSPPQSLPRSPPEESWSPPQSLPRSPPEESWSPPQSLPRSPPEENWSPPQSLPRQDWDSPESPPRQDCCHLRDLWQLPRKPALERYQEKDFPSLYSTHKIHQHYSSKEGSKSCRVSHSYSPTSPAAIKAKEAQLPASSDSVSLDVEAATLLKATENFQPARRKESQLIQMADGREDPDVPCQSARDETGSSAQSWASSDRSAAVLARKEEIEQAYQQVLLNFAAVATMLLETQPCMTEAMEAALQTTLRKFGNYYECKLKDFIDHFDLAEDS